MSSSHLPVTTESLELASESALQDFKAQMVDDSIVHKHLSPLYDTLLVQNLSSVACGCAHSSVEVNRTNVADQLEQLETYDGTAEGEEVDCQGKAHLEEYARLSEITYKKMKDFDRLSFLYLIMGDFDNLTRMSKIAKARGDFTGQFINALHIGNVEERFKLLHNAEKLDLAYLTAKTHGYFDVGVDITNVLLKGYGPNLPDGMVSSLQKPPTPVYCCGDSPLTTKGGDKC